MGRSAAVRTSLLMKGLDAALRSDHAGLDVHYMTTVAIASREISGCEALVRFLHPELGPVSPAEFVPLAEQHGLAGLLGDFVQRRVLRDLADGLLPAGRVAVNVSALELSNAGFGDRLLDLIEAAGLPIGRIGVEVTETAVAEHFAEAVEALHRLRAAGVPVALDDFGTGHASLDYLARLPCDTVKVDQSFIAGLGKDERCAAIVAGVIGMAHAMGHQVIAEGVETADQLAALAGLECDEAQGYLFGRPGPPSAIPGPRIAAPRTERDAAPRLVAKPWAAVEVLTAQVLVDLARDVGEATDLATGFAVVLSALRPYVDLTGGSVQVLGDDGIRLAVAHPMPTAEALQARIPAGQGVGGSVIATGQVRYLPDITAPKAAVSAARRSRSTTRNTRSYLAVPLFVDARCVGLVQIDSVEAEAFGPDVQLLLAACALPLARLLAPAEQIVLDRVSR